MKNVVFTAKNTSLFHRMQVRNSFDYAKTFVVPFAGKANLALLLFG